MRIDRHRCIGCGGCASVCPVGAIELSSSGVRVSKSCTKCKVCERVCPMGAIEVD